MNLNDFVFSGKNKSGRSAGQKSRSSSAGHKPRSRDGSLDGAKSEVKDFRRRSSQSSVGKRGDLRARYWAFLFENLRRAVDEIYHTCETDESVVECKVMVWVPVLQALKLEEHRLFFTPSLSIFIQRSCWGVYWFHSVHPSVPHPVSAL